MSGDDDDPLRRVRLDKLETLRGMGIDPYPVGFSRTDQAAALDERYAALPAGTETNEPVRVAGRIRAARNSGMFIDLHDASGKIQIFSHKDSLPPEDLALLRLLDIGDLIGVEGRVRRTPRGELTVNATALTLLAKALRPLPEKYHGLADIELRYRQRYLDLIMNPQSRETLRRRSLIIAEMRAWLLARGYLEVETPMLHTIPGGAAARPFVTHHNALDIELYLRIAPELHLKRLVVGGLSDKVFEINRCFRNEGLSPRHNPEFTTLELYEAYADYTDMMTLTEQIVAQAAETAAGGLRISYGGTAIDLTPPWPRRSMAELVLRGDRGRFSRDRRRGGRAGSGAAHRLRAQRNRELGPGARSGVRRARRGPAAAAGSRDRLSARHLAARQGRPQRSAPRRAVRDLCLRLGDRQRLLRAQRPARSARPLRGADAGAGGRRRGGAAARRGLRAWRSNTGCRPAAGSASASTGSSCC